MSYKPELSTDGGKTFAQNGLVFATHAEAEISAKDVFSRWLAATDYRVVESDLPPTHVIIAGVIAPLQLPATV